jgi:ribosome-binding protein aMBF1 (putative translation factor)
MKKHPIDQVQILIRGDKDQVFVGPKAKLRPLMKLLTQNDFKLSNGTENVSWETLAKDRIEKYSKPGLALRGARIKEGLSQVALAKALDVPQYNISKMESGARPIGKKMAQRLAEILKVDYRIFL